MCRRPPSGVSFCVRGDARLRVTASAASYRRGARTRRVGPVRGPPAGQRLRRRRRNGRRAAGARARYERTPLAFGLIWPEGEGGDSARRETAGAPPAVSGWRPADRATFLRAGRDLGVGDTDRRAPPAVRGRPHPDGGLREPPARGAARRRPARNGACSRPVSSARSRRARTRRVPARGPGPCSPTRNRKSNSDTAAGASTRSATARRPDWAVEPGPSAAHLVRAYAGGGRAAG